MAEQGSALMTVFGVGEAPTLKAAADQLKVSASDIDESFGIVPIDPERGIYCVLVRSDHLPESVASSRRYRGPFSDPKIAPYRRSSDNE